MGGREIVGEGVLSEDDAIHNSFSFLFAGSDTTSNALTVCDHATNAPQSLYFAQPPLSLSLSPPISSLSPLSLPLPLLVVI